MWRSDEINSDAKRLCSLLGGDETRVHIRDGARVSDIERLRTGHKEVRDKHIETKPGFREERA